MAACVFEGSSSHPTMHCWRRLLYSYTVQTDRWRAILHREQAIVLPQRRKSLQVKEFIVDCTHWWNSVDQIYRVYTVQYAVSETNTNICYFTKYLDFSSWNVNLIYIWVIFKLMCLFLKCILNTFKKSISLFETHMLLFVLSVLIWVSHFL